MHTSAPETVEARLARLEGEITHLRRRRFSLGAAYVLAIVAMVGLSTVGTASALSGSNTVFTDDIVNGNVQTVDLSFKTIVNPTLVTAQSNVGADANASISATCPAGYQPLNGWWTQPGFALTPYDVVVYYDPMAKRWSWTQWVKNNTADPSAVALTVVCGKNLPYATIMSAGAGTNNPFAKVNK